MLDDGLNRARIVEGTGGEATQEKPDRKAEGGLQKSTVRRPKPEAVASWHPRRSDRSAGEGGWSNKTRYLVWNGDVAAPRVRTGDGAVFADGKGAVETVEVHISWSLKAPAVSVAVK